MTKIWKYDLGKWIEDGYELPDWVDDTEFSDYLELCGFYPHCAFKWGEDGNGICFYEKYNGNQFFCNLDHDHNVFHFYIPNMPSFLMFKKEYSDSFCISQTKFARIDDLSLLNKDKIVEMNLCFFKERQTITFRIDDGTPEGLVHTKEFCMSKRYDGKLVYIQDAKEWIKENLNYEF